MLYISNAFSLGMLKHSQAHLEVSSIGLDLAKVIVREEPWTSSVGHEATASIMTRLLGVYIPVHRTSVKLEPGDRLLVFQLKIRLPEGKILSEPELQELIDKELYSWRLVDVLEEEEDVYA